LRINWDGKFHVVGHFHGRQSGAKDSDGTPACEIGRRGYARAGVGLAFDDTVFGFSRRRANRTRPALSIMGDSVGDKASKTWLKLMLPCARNREPGSIQGYMHSFIKDDFAIDAS